MTPLQIEIMLHYYGRAGDYREGDFSAPAVREAIDGFLRDGVLRRYEGATGAAYVATERLQAFIDHICGLPLPRQTWVMP